MYFLKSNIKDRGTIAVKCPVCCEPKTLTLFNFSTSVIIDAVRFHSKYTAICPECKTVFSFPKEKGRKLFLKLPIAVTENDLTVLKKGNK